MYIVSLHLQKYNPIIIVPTFFLLFSHLTCIFMVFLVILHRSRTRKRALLRSNPPATWLCPHWKQCFKSRPAHGRLTDSWRASLLRKPYQRTVSALSQSCHLRSVSTALFAFAGANIVTYTHCGRIANPPERKKSDRTENGLFRCRGNACQPDSLHIFESLLGNVGIINVPHLCIIEEFTRERYMASLFLQSIVKV